MESVTWDTTGFRGMNPLTGNVFNLEALNSILQPFQERNRVLLSPLKVQRVIRSIPPEGHIELFLVPAGIQLVYQKLKYALSCLWVVHIKDPFLLIRKSSL